MGAAPSAGLARDCWASPRVASPHGATAETISRWENDRLEVDPIAWVVLGAVVRDHAAGETHTVASLRAARSRPKRPDTAVRLEIA